jgi:hypothetical protein
MKGILLVIFSLLFALSSIGQAFKQCNVYQFPGTDSLKKQVVLKETFNNFGKILSEVYSNYKEDDATGTDDAKYFYFYTDTLLTKRTCLQTKEGDSTKALYYYNDKRQLIKQETFEFKRRIKNDLPPGKDILFDSDFEKKRTWEQTSAINFTYDDKGREIEFYAPEIHWDDQNRYIWKYDSIGRVIQHISYQDKREIWVEHYTYSDGGYEIYFSWSDNYATHKEIYKLDSKGRVTEKIWKGRVKENGGEEIERTVTQYSSDGYILRTIVYNNDAKPEITHIYVYK